MSQLWRLGSRVVQRVYCPSEAMYVVHVNLTKRRICNSLFIPGVPKKTCLNFKIKYFLFRSSESQKIFWWWSSHIFTFMQQFSCLYHKYFQFYTTPSPKTSFSKPAKPTSISKCFWFRLQWNNSNKGRSFYDQNTR